MKRCWKRNAEQIEAAVKEYYDTASEEDLAEQSEWARMVGPNFLREAPEFQSIGRSQFSSAFLNSLMNFPESAPSIVL